MKENKKMVKEDYLYLCLLTVQLFINIAMSILKCIRKEANTNVSGSNSAR